MARLVDADELKHDLEWLEGDKPVYLDVMSTIDERTTVDAEPVVRCKDCRYYHVYWESNGHTEKGYGACDWINDNSVREDHFCSWGERREDADS